MNYDLPGPGAQLLGAILLQERDYWHGRCLETAATAEKALRELAEARAENVRLRETIEDLRQEVEYQRETKEVPF